MDVPEEVYENEETYQAFMEQVAQIADPRLSGKVLTAFFQGWLDRYGSDPTEPELQKNNARAMLADIQSGLDRLYQCDVDIAKLEDQLDIACVNYVGYVEELRVLYRRMAFWRGSEDSEVKEAARLVCSGFSPEEAAHILDLSDLFATDIPRE